MLLCSDFLVFLARESRGRGGGGEEREKGREAGRK